MRTAVSCTVTKEGKNTQDVEHQRPIAMTSALSKLLERHSANRRAVWLDGKELLGPWQAGFREGRSTTDQTLRLTQYVFDGFQTRDKTVTCFFDYSKAYDTVWRTGLLRKMQQLGVPHRFIEWVKAWLTNRLARVRVNGTAARFSPLAASLHHLHQ